MDRSIDQQFPRFPETKSNRSVAAIFLLQKQTWAIHYFERWRPRFITTVVERPNPGSIFRLLMIQILPFKQSTL